MGGVGVCGGGVCACVGDGGGVMGVCACVGVRGRHAPVWREAGQAGHGGPRVEAAI